MQTSLLGETVTWTEDADTDDPITFDGLIRAVWNGRDGELIFGVQADGIPVIVKIDACDVEFKRWQ